MKYDLKILWFKSSNLNHNFLIFIQKVIVSIGGSLFLLDFYGNENKITAPKHSMKGMRQLIW